jgi:hypothetical protein
MMIVNIGEEVRVPEGLELVETGDEVAPMLGRFQPRRGAFRGGLHQGDSFNPASTFMSRC